MSSCSTGLMIARVAESILLLNAGKVLRDWGQAPQLRDDEAHPGPAAAGKYRDQLRKSP
ncbi:hypothetical protein [Arthrobacter sp. FW306-04-A]|uniref:hypothetical protein n=1 Tax=Arthrobacter sp. FW306-04-A TaxID=2879619 RepID=UPI0037C0450B|nr:hypothetical protein LFT43_15135 [Arthrobacter sp. FW306-04-A]